MNTASSLTELRERYGLDRVAVACGVFDGVHRGHQAILRALCAEAAAGGVVPVVLTFDPHPRAVLGHGPAPALLTPREQQLGLLGDLGVQAVVILPFSPALAALSAHRFVHQQLLPPGVRLHAVCVGEAWRFGAHGRGDVRFLRSSGRRHGYRVVSVPPFTWYGRTVSSTRIRHAVTAGRLGAARRMLGRPYRLYGRVGSGKGIGGAVLGFPTANLSLRGLVAPPPGVYAARGQIQPYAPAGRSTPQPGALYIGTAPTVTRRPGQPPAEPLAEMHFLEPQADLRGAELEVEVVTRIRPDRRFPSLDALRAQIALDIVEIRKALAATP